MTHRKNTTHIHNLIMLEKLGSYDTAEELSKAIGIGRNSLFVYKKNKRVPRVVDNACLYLLSLLGPQDIEEQYVACPVCKEQESNINCNFCNDTGSVQIWVAKQFGRLAERAKK